MTDALCLSTLANVDRPIEMVERKGIGHPDTICDALAENLSRRLCEYYRDNFGTVYHHNVDKALLCAGVARPQFGGGCVDIPMDIFLAGRAVGHVGGKPVPIEEIAIQGSQQWLRDHLHALDVDKHVRIHSLIRHGSSELIGLFSATGGTGSVPLANDTSFGVGYAPLSPLERLVKAFELERSKRPEWGEDTKIMAVRNREQVQITVACAIVDTYVSDAAEYRQAVERLQSELTTIAGQHGFSDLDIKVNAADSPVDNRWFLTVTGTSGESGDDGQVGRGNRANGLITPNRPMSLEALAGKNPINHVGKLYNVAASRIADTLVSEFDDVMCANCALVSQIGRPITDPLVIDIALELSSDRSIESLRDGVSGIAYEHINQLTDLTEHFIAGDFELF